MPYDYTHAPGSMKHGIIPAERREAIDVTMVHDTPRIEHVSRGLRVRIIDTPTGAVSVIRPVAEALLKNGIISGEIDGKLTASDALTVKAAVMAHGGVCDFCSAPGPTHSFDVPDFDMMGNLESTGGWAACDTCNELVLAGKKKDLLKRSLDTMAFAKFTKPALEELHGKFWAAWEARGEIGVTMKAIRGILDGAVDDDIDPRGTVRNASEQQRRNVIKRELQFTDQEVDLCKTGHATTEMMKRMLDWKRKGGFTLAREHVKPIPPTPPDLVPHWQRALDMKFLALVELKRRFATVDPDLFREQLRERGLSLTDPLAVKEVVKRKQAQRALYEMGFDDDLTGLQNAETYSFNRDTIAAIREAALSIPHDTPLSAIETPAIGAGWFWFAEPLPISTSSIISDKVHALLWSWENVGPHSIKQVELTEDIMARLPIEKQQQLARWADEHNQPGEYKWTSDTEGEIVDLLREAGVTQTELDAHTTSEIGEPNIVFTAYVIDEKGQYGPKGVPSPSTRFYWSFGDTFHEMLEANRQAWQRAYGPGSEHEADANVMGEELTIKSVGELALFFVMACVWFKQTVPVLTREPGHIERHARKRMQREHKLAEPPKVQIIALRKSARTEPSTAPADRQGTAHEYHCRWIVKGHARLQAYGPGRKERRLIWIDAYVKGPEDKPLRTREKVYAVIR